MGDREGFRRRFVRIVRSSWNFRFSFAVCGWGTLGLGLFVFVVPLVGPYLGYELTTDHWGLRLYASGAGILIALAGYFLLRLVEFWPLRRSVRGHGMFDRR